MTLDGHVCRSDAAHPTLHMAQRECRLEEGIYTMEGISLPTPRFTSKDVSMECLKTTARMVVFSSMSSWSLLKAPRYHTQRATNKKNAAVPHLWHLYPHVRLPQQDVGDCARIALHHITVALGVSTLIPTQCQIHLRLYRLCYAMRLTCDKGRAFGWKEEGVGGDGDMEAGTAKTYLPT